MSNTKHTPGPWILGKNNNTVLSPDRMYLADVFQMDVGADQQLANAKLMAAAPDLLEILLRAVKSFDAEYDKAVDEGKDPQTPFWVMDAKAVIKKVTE